MKIPSVSVIIPLYNAEKYIGDCLESILNQTFQDFEVIVVDDCSTDNSLAIVQSYLEKFGGRLKIARTKKNSGNPGEPSNIGLNLSRGEYLSILDNDDALTFDALEKFYTAAKKFNADVVGAEKYYRVPDNFWHDADYLQQLNPVSYQRGGVVSEPTLISADFSERVKDCANGKFLWNVWSKLIRRDFLVENEITMTNEMANDMLLTCFLVCSAEKYVRIPDTVNIYRVVDNSLSHKERDPVKHLQKYCSALIVGFNHFDKFLSGREFFKQNPDVKYLAIDTYVREILDYLTEIYRAFPSYKLDKILREEFSKQPSAALLAFIFNSFNVCRLQLSETHQRAAELEKIIKQDKAYISELEKLITQLNAR